MSHYQNIIFHQNKQLLLHLHFIIIHSYGESESGNVHTHITIYFKILTCSGPVVFVFEIRCAWKNRILNTSMSASSFQKR